MASYQTRALKAAGRDDELAVIGEVVGQAAASEWLAETARLRRELRTAVQQRPATLQPPLRETHRSAIAAEALDLIRAAAFGIWPATPTSIRHEAAMTGADRRVVDTALAITAAAPGEPGDERDRRLATRSPAGAIKIDTNPAAPPEPPIWDMAPIELER